MSAAWDVPSGGCVLKYLLCSVFLFFLVSSQGQTPAQKPPSPNDNKSVQVFLTSSGKHDSPVTLTQAQLSVFVDKQPARVDTLRSATSDALLFAVVLDTSTADASGASRINKAALQLFKGFSTYRNLTHLLP